MVTHDSGATWVDQELPGTGELVSVACALLEDCVAVGFSLSSSTTTVAFYTTDGGTTWTASALPAFAYAALLSGLSCPSAGACYALAVPQGSFGASVVIESADAGATWVVATSRTASFAGIALSGDELTCTSASDCVALGEEISAPTGSSNTGSGFSWGVVALVTRNAWASYTTDVISSTNVPVSISTPLYLPIALGITCATEADCVAVGTDGLIVAGSNRPAPVPTPIAWSTMDGGATWSTSSPPLPSGASEGILESVSCPGIDACYAVGYSTVVRTSPSVTTFYPAEQLVDVSVDGGKSFVAEPPAALPATDPTSGLVGVACTGILTCVASGAAGLAIPSEYSAIVVGTTSGGVNIGGPSGEPISSGEGLGGQNPAEPCLACALQAAGISAQSSAGDPVDTATGNFTTSAVDLAVAGKGIPLSFSRTYNSLAAGVDGPLGYGWSSDLFDHLSVNGATGVVTVHQGGGAEVSFSPDGSGGYSAPPRVIATLVRNPDGTFTFVRMKTTTFTFSPEGKLLSESDLAGESITFAYDSAGELVKVTGASGRSLSLTWSGGHIGSVTDPLARSVSFTYDSSGNLASVTDPGGRVTSFTYNASHELTSVTDPMGRTTRMIYANASLPGDPPGTHPVLSEVDPAGGITTFAYEGTPLGSAGGATTVVSPSGEVQVDSYAFGERTSLTLGPGTPLAATWRFAYDPVTAMPIKVTNPLGKVTTIAYDALGRLLSTSVPPPSPGAAPSTTTLSYEDASDPLAPTSVTGPSGHTTSFSYDQAGDVLSVTSPEGQVTTATYNADGELTSTTAPRGNLPGGSPGSFTSRVTYNPAGEVATTTNPLGQVTTYTYDQDGELSATRAPGGQISTYAYDSLGELASTTAASGTPEAATTTYAYDQAGELITETNPAGDTTSYTYDSLGRLASTTNPLGETTTSSYNAAGELVSTTQPNGQVVSDTYDAAGELRSVSYPGTSAPPKRYTYDAAGELTALSGATGIDTYSYTPDGLLASVTNAAGATISYAYDPSGRLVATAYPNGQVVTQAHTPNGQVASISDWLGNSTSYTYGPNGNLDTEAFASGVTGHFSYNPAGELTSLSYTGSCKAAPQDKPNQGKANHGKLNHGKLNHGKLNHGKLNHGKLNHGKLNQGGLPPCPVIYARSYSYNPAGLVASSTSPTPPGPPTSSSYSYNPLNELSGVTPSPPSPGPAKAATSYAYDMAGNLTGVGFASGASMSLSYNAGSELTAMSLSRESQAGSSPLGVAAFTYNALGERTAESITQPSPPGSPNQALRHQAPRAPATPGTNPAPPLADLSYGYNPLGEMTSYSGPSGGSPLSVASSAPGQVQHMAPGKSAQASATYAYDPSGLLASETSTTTGQPASSCALAPSAETRPPNSRMSEPSCTTTTAFTWNASDGCNSIARRWRRRTLRVAPPPKGSWSWAPRAALSEPGWRDPAKADPPLGEPLGEARSQGSGGQRRGI